MKKNIVLLLIFLCATVMAIAPSHGNEFKEREAKIAQYKKWLDTLGPRGSQYWLRLDSTRRPHRLYLGEAFRRADAQSQEQFIDKYSNYLAGHPEKFMLIDLFDADTSKLVGEYGFGGFKMYIEAPPPDSDNSKIDPTDTQ
jgi:hypothetical protein